VTVSKARPMRPRRARSHLGEVCHVINRKDTRNPCLHVIERPPGSDHSGAKGGDGEGCDCHQHTRSSDVLMSLSDEVCADCRLSRECLLSLLILKSGLQSSQGWVCCSLTKVEHP
jgi:hypothetical protein